MTNPRLNLTPPRSARIRASSLETHSKVSALLSAPRAVAALGLGNGHHGRFIARAHHQPAGLWVIYWLAGWNPCPIITQCTRMPTEKECPRRTAAGLSLNSERRGPECPLAPPSLCRSPPRRVMPIKGKMIERAEAPMQVPFSSRRGIQLNYWVSKSFSKLFSKSYLAWCNSIELLKLILKILLRWILLKGHVPTSITALVGNLFQKDFEKDFQNVNRIAKVKNLFLKRDFKKIFKIIFNNSIEFLSCNCCRNKSHVSSPSALH